MPAQVVASDEPEIDIAWDGAGQEVATIEHALANLCDPIPDGAETARLASGSGATPVEGNPLVQPNDRKRAQSRPSMKAVLAGEIDTESELDVPTFIRRHNSTHG